MLEMEEHGCASGGEDDGGRGTVWCFKTGIRRMRWKSMGVLQEKKMMVNLEGHRGDKDQIGDQGAQVTSGQKGDGIGGRACHYFTGASDWT